MAKINQKITQVEEKINKIYKEIDVLEQQAKNNLKKSQEAKGSAKEMYKQRCLIALKKKKQLQTQAKSYNSHQNMLQNAVFTAQNIQGHKQMYDALKGAVDTQKEAMKGIDIDKFDELQDEMLDMKMQTELMNQMLTKNYDMELDEDEFQDEFAQLQKQVAVAKKQNLLPNAINAPKQQISNNMNIDSFLK